MPELRVRAGVLTGNAAVDVGAEGEGMVLGDTVNTAVAAAVGGRAWNGAGRRRHAPRDRGSDRVRGRRHARGQGTRAAGPRLDGAARRRRRRRRAARRRAGGAVRRPRTRARDDHRRRGGQRVDDAPPAWSPSSVMPEPASRGCCGSSSSTSTGSRRPAGGIRAAALPTARASRTGRWRRWSAPAPGSPRRRTPPPRARSCALSSSSYVTDERERRLVEPRLAHLLGFEQRAGSRAADLFSGWRLFFERMAMTNR